MIWAKKTPSQGSFLNGAETSRTHLTHYFQRHVSFFLQLKSSPSFFLLLQGLVWPRIWEIMGTVRVETGAFLNCLLPGRELWALKCPLWCICLPSLFSKVCHLVDWFGNLIRTALLSHEFCSCMPGCWKFPLRPPNV